MKIDKYEWDGAIIISGYDPQFEYFCPKCLQLRLSFDSFLITCGNCGNPIIDCIRGFPGELNKEKLQEDYSKKEKI